jgi:4-hydroxy-3-polyprenylbenzoate decarboxylase
LLQALCVAERRVSLIVSGHGWRLLETESGIRGLAELRANVGPANWDNCVTVYDDADRGAAPASGSVRTSGMVVCPCSMGTLSAIAQGSSRSLVERSADVTLKERRKLILVPRETPLSSIHLENMLKLSREGVVILPAAPGFYHRPSTIAELIDFVVARVLDQLEIEHDVGRRWTQVESR